MIRHVLRQFAVQTLYQMEVGQMTKEEAIENVEWMVEGLKEEAMELMAEEVTISQSNAFCHAVMRSALPSLSHLPTTTITGNCCSFICASHSFSSAALLSYSPPVMVTSLFSRALM